MFKKNNNLEYLVGNKEISNLSLPPFETLICNFLGELSKELDSGKSAKKYPDIKALAFWCRKQKILNYTLFIGVDTFDWGNLGNVSSGDVGWLAFVGCEFCCPREVGAVGDGDGVGGQPRAGDSEQLHWSIQFVCL